MQPDTPEINEIQVRIMRHLFTREVLRFSEINTEELPSDQLSYHLRQLTKRELIEKDKAGHYTLSVKGRSQAVLLDGQSDHFVRQGFVACRIILSRLHDGERQYLVQRRLKVPYRGYLSEPGGKITFSEDVIISAKRNMLTETGLNCDMTVRGLAHFKDSYQGQVVQDKYFFVVAATNPTGILLPRGATGENLWMTLSQIKNDSKTHKGVLHMIDIAETSNADQWFIEDTNIATEY